MNDPDLKKFELFAEFSDGELDAIIELLDEKTVWEGRALFREGEESEGLILLLAGSARLESKRGAELSTLPEGSHFGGLSLMTLSKRQCSAIAEGECRVLQLTPTAYRRLVEDAPRSACRLAEAIVKQFADCVRDGLDAAVPSLDGHA